MKGVLMGFKLPLEFEGEEAVELALSRVKVRLEHSGVIVDGWEYDKPENLVLIRLRCEPETLPEARRIAAEALEESIGLKSEPAALGPSGFVDFEEVLPSPSILGFLIRVVCMKHNHQGQEKGIMSLLIHYLCGFSRVRTLLTASYLSLDPTEVDEELLRLAEMGYLTSDLSGLTRDGVKLLNSLLPKLRVQPLAPAGEKGVKVVDEEGSLEPFSLDRLAASLYDCGVPYTAVPVILERVERALEDRKYVSKRSLAVLTCSLIDEVLPGAEAAEKFYRYVYALERLYVEVVGEVRRLSWGLLRRFSSDVLGERGLKPSRRLIQLHAELIAHELRELLASAPLLYEGRVLKLDELKSIGRQVAPKVSSAWVDLATSTPAEVAERYRSLALNYLAATSGWDQGELKELTSKSLLLLSSSVMLRLGLLPSNSAGLNIWSLRSEAARLEMPVEVRTTLQRFCKLALKLIHSPAILSPRERRSFERALSELKAEVAKLPYVAQTY